MYETGNPVPSSALEDMADNAQVFDRLVTQTSGTVTDRLGNIRRPFQQIVTDMGFNPVSGSFQAGATITEYNQCLIDEATGTFYSWNGALPKVVSAGSTPATAGGIGALSWVDRTDLLLRSELASKSGVSLVSTNIFSVYVTEAPDDGVTDATSYFTSAGSLSEANGNIDIVVKPPITKYYLATSPTIPKNTNVVASPDWFSGPGTMPIHAYQQLSEGVDPRKLTLGGSSVLMAPKVAQTGRLWAIQGAVDVDIPPAVTGTDIDSVGLSGRAYARADGARVWGLVCLGMLGPGVADSVTQCITAEFDINNNKASAAKLDDVVGSRGIFIVSGGMYRPQEAQIIFATMPNNGSGDNRFVVGTRYSGNSFLRAATWYDDEVATPATSISHLSSHEFRYMGQTGFIEINSSSGGLNIKPIVADGVHFLSSNAAKSLFQISDNYIRETIPVQRVANERGIAGGAVLDTTLYDRFVITEAGTINGLSTGVTGQSIKIANLSGGNVVLSRSSNMRTPSAAAVTIPQLAVANFEYMGGVWLFNYVSAANN